MHTYMHTYIHTYIHIIRAICSRTFSEVLQEVKDWMVLPENSEEIVVLYLDTKFRLKPEQASLYTVCMYVCMYACMRIRI
jgi:hypothetical protein